MKAIYCLITVLTLSFSVNAQGVYFQKVFGSNQVSNIGKSVVQSGYGSIYFLGNFNDNVSGAAGVELIKLDTAGNIKWRHQVINDSAIASRIIYTTYNTLLINGQLTDATGNTDAFALETDTFGNVLHYNSYGYPSTTESFLALCQTTDGGYIFSGFTTNPAGPGNAMYVVKTDSAGNLQWEQTYSDSVNSVSDDIVQTPDGGYVFAGDKKTATANYNIHVIKIDSAGLIIWESDIISAYNSGCKNLIINKAGKFIVIGESATATSTYFDPVISQLDSAGNVDWSHIIPCTNGPDAGFDIIEPSAGNYLVTGYGFNLVANTTDLLIMRLDSFGNEVNRSYYGSAGYDQGFAITEAFDKSGFLAAGFTIVNSENKYFLIYGDNMGIATALTEKSKAARLYVYPNPVNEFLKFDLEITSKTTVTVKDIFGRTVIKNVVYHFTRRVDITALADGFYTIEVIESQKQFVSNFIVLHH